jgi:hypothetical protein
MPAEAWYLLIGAVMIGVVVALVKGRGLSLIKDKDGVKINVKEQAAAPLPSRRIDVANGATIEGSTVGDIAGVLQRGTGTAPAPDGDLTVLDKGRITTSKVGDVAGIKQDAGAKPGG